MDKTEVLPKGLRLTTEEREFLDQMKYDPSKSWVNFDPPFLRRAFTRLIKRGYFVERYEGRETEFSWTRKGREAFGLAGGAFEQQGATATGEPIRVWRFDDAPKIWQDLSTNGGDEDWLALIPCGMEVPSFLEDNMMFGCCDTQKHVLATGEVILIGCHA